jgi:ribonuclease HI
LGSISLIDRTLQLASMWDASRVAERVRRRATILGRAERGRRREIIRAQDRLILRLYGQAVPADWHLAWFDGSVRGEDGNLRAGIGGLLLAAQGRMLVAELSEPAADALTTEIAAWVAVLRAALHGGVERLRAHTDCDALAALWRRRDDPRLEVVRGLVGTLRRFELRHVPRQYNQPAHRLARRALAHSDEETT